jgi:hypothetical protein
MSRADNLRRYNNPKSLIPNILLMTIGAGGVGLNIAGANRLIIGAPQWAPGTEEQATGRVHRLPQDKQVSVYKAFAPLSFYGSLVRPRYTSKNDTRRETLLPLVIQEDGRPASLSRGLPTREDLMRDD